MVQRDVSPCITFGFTSHLVESDLHGVDEHAAAAVGDLAADARGVVGDVEHGHHVARHRHCLSLARRMVRHGRLLQLSLGEV